LLVKGTRKTSSGAPKRRQLDLERERGRKKDISNYCDGLKGGKKKSTEKKVSNKVLHLLHGGEGRDKHPRTPQSISQEEEKRKDFLSMHVRRGRRLNDRKKSRRRFALP